MSGLGRPRAGLASRIHAVDTRAMEQQMQQRYDVPTTRALL
jgi:hypothetical protein